MLIADIDLRGGGRERVGVVGSCRVLTPMRKAVFGGCGRHVWHACFGYTHSAREAVQHITFCRGRMDIPVDLAPYIFMNTRCVPFKTEWVSVVESCRTFLVEISTVEDLVCGEFVFNNLCLATHLVRGHGPGILSWYRNLSADPCEPEVVALAEKSLADNGFVLNAPVARMLRQMRRVTADAGSFDDAIRAVVFDPNRRWIFVPIFNVSERPGEQVAARVRLREMLLRGATANGWEFLDPTAAIERAGRQRALDGDSATPTHYARDFERVIGEVFCRYIAEPFAPPSL